MANADIVARNSTEFLQIMEDNAAKTSSGEGVEYFRLSEFKPGMSKESYKGNTIITTKTELEFEVAKGKIEADKDLKEFKEEIEGSSKDKEAKSD